MKHSTILCLLLVVGLWIRATDFALASQVTSKVPVAVQYIYAPLGFDNNDGVEVVATGYLPSTCYQSPTVEAKRVGRKIVFKAKAVFLEQTPCTEILVPFSEVVSLGRLESGSYQLIGQGVVDEPAIQTSLSIAKAASSDVDQFAYAIVDTILVAPGSDQVTLKGFIPSNCYEFDRIEYLSNSKDTYSILPLMKKISPHCPMKWMYMSVDWTLPHELSKKEILLHVRVMNGKSVNKIHWQSVP